jgi:hypothetical protein
MTKSSQEKCYKGFIPDNGKDEKTISFVVNIF